MLTVSAEKMIREQKTNSDRLEKPQFRDKQLLLSMANR